jgi:hypothetical protein
MGNFFHGHYVGLPEGIFDDFYVSSRLGQFDEVDENVDFG